LHANDVSVSNLGRQPVRRIVVSRRPHLIRHKTEYPLISPYRARALRLFRSFKFVSPWTFTISPSRPRSAVSLYSSSSWMLSAVCNLSLRLDEHDGAVDQSRVQLGLSTSYRVSYQDPSLFVEPFI